MIALLLLLAAPHPAIQTRCAACHTAEGWNRVSFDHARTGFPLEGRHQQATCRGCHADNEFKAPIPQRCSTCHRDAHQGEFGARCEGCHDAFGWTSKFDANAHRNTGFPLIGRHAFIPCEECHLSARDRTFSRATVQCSTCHLQDYMRTAGTALDHRANGFSTQCTDCHGPFSFRGARFQAHEACFELQAGSHSGISCLDCHRSLPGFTVTGACNTGTASCTSCHSHTCARTDPRHSDVAGYQCKDRKCYECHRFSASTARRLFR